ncbi:MAG: pyridoxal phosphate-dependent aminotransferase [Candidatus Sericytochromatia bacterium]
MSKLDNLQRLDLLGLTPQNQAAPLVRLKLDEDESALGWPAALQDRFTEMHREADWHRYPPAHTDLKRAIAEPMGMNHDWISLGAGADDVLRNVLMAWCLRGTVVYPVPTNPQYGLIAQTLGIKHVAVMLKADFGLPLDQVIATARLQEARVVILSNPNTPTGNLFSRDEIMSVAREVDALVVVDESYIDFTGLTVSDVVPELENLAVIRSFAHAWPAASFRLGYMMAHPRVIAELEKVRLPHNVSASALLAGQLLLSHQHLVRPAFAEVDRERESLRAALSTVRGVVTWPSAANFLLVGTTVNSEELARRLLSMGVLVRSFNRSPLMNCIRVTVATPSQNAEFVEAMREIFGSA